MPLISMRSILDHAAEHNYGVPAFNINNLEQLHAVMGAAAKLNAPVIVAASRSARKYAGDLLLTAMIKAAAEHYPNVPFAYHQDHGNAPSTCVSAIQNGFTSVMMDGSLAEDGKSPASYDYNVAVTAEVVKIAHAVGVSVEGELGCLGSLETGEGEAEDGHGAQGKLAHDQLLTDPDQAVDFVTRTKVDALAVAIGTSHGAYKFTRKPDGAILAMNVIKSIHQKLPNTHMVMHGSSSVPQALQDEINKFGGQIKQTWGVPIAEIQEGIKNGVRKINVDTDCRMAMTAAIRKSMSEDLSNFDPRTYLKLSMEAMQKICAERLEQFGCAEKASSLKTVSLADMAKKYSTGALDPVTAAGSKTKVA